jgi:ABC-type uncharacterized transport system permease subunit
MILSTASPALSNEGAWLLIAVAVVLYALAALPAGPLRRFSAAALLGGFALHALLLLIDIGGIGLPERGARLGFGPVLSMTVWLVVGVYTVESRLVPLPAVRQWLGIAGVMAVGVAGLFPGEVKPPAGAGAAALRAGGELLRLFGAAVLHGLMLDADERRLRRGGLAGAGSSRAMGMPLLQLERLTFRFVQAGFVVLTATLALGVLNTVHWRWGDHKAVFSLLAWSVFAALLAGRHLRGWRGRHATRATVGQSRMMKNSIQLDGMSVVQ